MYSCNNENEMCNMLNENLHTVIERVESLSTNVPWCLF